MNKNHKPETRAIHAGRKIDPMTRAVSPPLYLNTTFERGDDGSYPGGFDYIRDGHPNHSMLEDTVAALEYGTRATAFASGTAATMAVFHSAGPGHIVATRDCYRGTLQQLQEVIAGENREISFVDTASTATVADALRPDTRLLWLETPSNPLLGISDIAALHALLRDRDIVLAVDSTIATPILQQPLQLGADVVVHSSTKYIGGHSDVSGGILVGRDHQLMDRARDYLIRTGAVPSAFDCWLLQRSVATLPLRARLHSENALAVARYLEQQTAVSRVYYPGLESHPGHAVATSQMQGYGGVLSFSISKGEAAAREVASGTQLFTQATSIGGVESLIEHRASVEGPGTHAPADLLRLSVGLEHIDDLIADLQQALERIA
ncbi:MAG: cystathionine gamma-synthase [Gammaproteobacteria bacterium]|nr:cystathionine gamma-synthase [Gammaproteobacteria bacterium]